MPVDPEKKREYNRKYREKLKIKLNLEPVKMIDDNTKSESPKVITPLAPTSEIHFPETEPEPAVEPVPPVEPEPNDDEFVTVRKTDLIKIIEESRKPVPMPSEPIPQRTETQTVQPGNDNFFFALAKTVMMNTITTATNIAVPIGLGLVISSFSTKSTKSENSTSQTEQKPSGQAFMIPTSTSIG